MYPIAPPADPSDLAELRAYSDELLMYATHIEEIADATKQDIRQAALGNIRVSCQWCDGEFFVPATATGPHSCYLCGPVCDGY